jgi:NAD-dependent dihydropyrimidine dehydrogenase PreA subunit
MIKAGVYYDKCHSCRKCIARNACPTKALFKIDPEEPVSVDQSLCHGCGRCVLNCPHEALFVKEL